MRIDDPFEFLRMLTPWGHSDFLFSGFIFRGHGDSDYQLIPSALRKEKKSLLWKAAHLDIPIADQSEWQEWQLTAERGALAEFFGSVNAYGISLPFPYRLRGSEFAPILISHHFGQPEKWLPDDMYDLAALAQHHGIPTRLLDWSFDPLVAAYFAVSEQKESASEFCVWCLNAKLVGFLKPTVDRVPLDLIVPPYHENPNLAAQRGAFTHVADPTDGIWGAAQRLLQGQAPRLLNRTSLEDVISGTYQPDTTGEAMLVKLSSPRMNAVKVLKLLRQAGVGPARLFPGIDGVVKQILQ